MKITFILPGCPQRPVGGFKVVYEYANQLVSKGHGVSVIHARSLRNFDPGRLNVYNFLRNKARHVRDFLVRPEVRWHPIDSKVKMLYVLEPVACAIPDADVVFATSWPTAEYVNGYPINKGSKYYLIQGYETWDGYEEKVRATWRLPMHKIVVSRWLYDKGLGLGVRGADMVIIPNGINKDQFRIVRDIAGRPKRIVMVYHPAKIKGFADAMDALKQVYQACGELPTIIFSIFPRPKSLPKFIEYIYNPKVETIVNDIYNNCSIFVNSSWSEGFSLPPAEAMACGCSVVSTDNGGIREYAEDNVTALLSPPKNPNALAANIMRLIDDDGLRMRLAQKGYERIIGFTWKKSGDMLERYITDTISQ